LQAVVLDLLVPLTERYSICRVVRATFGLPVIMVDERPDDALGATLGADFYLDKPITAESIWASLHAVTSRRRLDGGALPHGELVLFSDTNAAFVDGRLLDLTSDEFVLLERLACVEGDIVSRSELARSFCDHAGKLDPELVEVHVVRLMAKLATRSSRRVVRSANRDGYILLAAQI
jgi:DNA-binding response OmpR family regulator